MSRDFLPDLTSLRVLHRAARSPVYGSGLLADLRQEGHSVSPGTLFPLLHAMEEAGFLESSEKAVAGRPRTYYRTTAEGRAALDRAKEKIRELADERVEDAADS